MRILYNNLASLLLTWYAPKLSFSCETWEFPLHLVVYHIFYENERWPYWPSAEEWNEGSLRVLVQRRNSFISANKCVVIVKVCLSLAELWCLSSTQLLPDWLHPITNEMTNRSRRHHLSRLVTGRIHILVNAVTPSCRVLESDDADYVCCIPYQYGRNFVLRGFCGILVLEIRSS